MESIQDFSDSRNKSWCIHCGGWLSQVRTNRDHVPSKSLLSQPYPDQLPVVQICVECNVSFSSDEQYFAAFLGAVLSGSTDPDVQTLQTAQRVFREHPNLRARIESAKTEYKTQGGETRYLWKPEQERIDRVILKNARGHAYYEIGEPMLEQPESIWSFPFVSMTPSEREAFEMPASDGFALWPEVGSRMLTRLVSGADLVDGWVSVQDRAYRYSVEQGGGIRVRSVIAEYLATEVCWEH